MKISQVTLVVAGRRNPRPPWPGTPLPAATSDSRVPTVSKMLKMRKRSDTPRCAGYGNIAPKTNWGRVMVFVYAMIGIPYMLVCVAMIGEVMADVFRFVYFELCCCGLCARRARRRRRQRDAGEGRRRENQLTDPPSLSQLYQDEMSRTRNQQAPTVVDDYDDLLDEEVIRYTYFHRL